MEIKGKRKLEYSFDVAVVGGGISGLCAAIASARHGARTALIQNRPMPGGNASSEIRMHICGAAGSGRYENARETGIVEELLLENRKRNYHDEFSLFDVVMWEKARFQDNLWLFLNTHMYEVTTDGNSISGISCTQLTSETEISIKADYFIDATGDGTLGAYAGAEYMFGTESREAFGEKHAPDEPDDYTMGNTILFMARDTGKKTKFEKPFWAHDVSEEMLANRGHSLVNYGYWWIELGGMETDTVKDYEGIRDELMKWAFGIWDHIKNKGDHGAGDYELSWVGLLPGKRESRRLLGDYVLKEQDLASGRIFDDAIAYGGWPMDMHVPGGIANPVLEPTVYIFLDDFYTIPYRSIYSRNIDNLFLAGRAISASKLAFGSIRVMGTTGVIGQAAGTAAALAAGHGISPRETGKNIRLLQTMLMRDDCFIPGHRFIDDDDYVKDAKIICSSQRQPCANIKNGYTRNIGKDINYWESKRLLDREFVEIKLREPVPVRGVHIRFDSNLTREIRPSIDYGATGLQIRGVPSELVRDYTVELLYGGGVVATQVVEGNYMRLNKHVFNGEEADAIRITVTATNGWPHVRIFDVKAY
ncbi:MAG: FAD-dependent oxidoreductase [Clostridia bacterium]|nr:FAD-dependent oxidoreductase [Clostridia bacterium]